MKKKIAVAVAIGFLIGLVLWVCGFSDDFYRFNLFVWNYMSDQVKALFLVK